MSINLQRPGFPRIIFPFISLMLLVSCTTTPLLPPEKQAVTDFVDYKPSMDVGSIYFNSRDLDSKSIFGAVVQGSSINYKLLARKGDLDSVTLMIMQRIEEGNHDYLDYLELGSVELTRSPMGEAQEAWTGEFTFETPGIYAYHFILKKGSEVLVYGSNQNRVSIAHESAVGTGGVGRITLDTDLEPYRQTVYFPETAQAKDKEWSNGIIYYIFPDRFRNGNKVNDPVPGKTWNYGHTSAEFHTNWSDPRPWVPGKNVDKHDGDDGEYNNDFYGGDLEGITQKLDYLKEMGVTMIYSTPINTSPSNHKYDSMNYMEIDPTFGGQKAFDTLIAEAKKRGIGFMMDASLNHASSASVYFDRYGIWPQVGAFEKEVITKESPYYDWFEFNLRAKNPDQMYNFWAVPTLANLKETPSYEAFAYGNPDSVTKHWINKGISGWRMDVAPWVSHRFWKEWRKAVKSTNPDTLTVAEVWFDSSHFLYGDEFDTTMNYIFRAAALNLGKGGNTEETRQSFELIQENYPKPVFYRMMNLTSTHDVPRTLWELGYKNYGDKNYDQIRPRFLQTVALQFTMPGMPTIYYGDEVGMTGGADPMNRGPLPWKDEGGDYGDFSLHEDYKRLSALRKTYGSILAEGELNFLVSGGNLLAYERTSAEGKKIIVLFNNGDVSSPISHGELTGSFKDLESQEILGLSGSLETSPRSYRILLKE
ncbi:MAG: hypothetical protein A2Z96_02860 [Spirochaetes bacterium GWB1_48_6]|nr:MAG: hypothetical protein A2Z96_02860 [Spirochaetes bacterium GWB1_48_6]